MLIYNVTIKIDRNIQKEWMRWMRAVHIPKMQREGNFVGHRICKLLGTDERDGFTYAVQYLCPDVGVYRQFQLKKEAQLDQTMLQRFPNQLVHFASVLEILE
ncbi:MAG: DUF4286 family protein [Bacteroidota bacterium]